MIAEERKGPFQRRMTQFSVTLALPFAVSNPSGCSINPHLIDTDIVRKGTRHSCKLQFMVHESGVTLTLTKHLASIWYVLCEK